MLDPRYRLRRFSPEDIEEHVAILNRITPERPTTIEQWRREDEFAHRPPMTCHQLSIEEVASGRLVAVGGTVTAPDSIGRGNFWIGAGVDPDHRGRGLGQALARGLEAAALESGAVCLWAAAPLDDARSVRFLRLQGFHDKLTNWQSTLHLDKTVIPGPDVEVALRRQEVVITDLAQEGPEDPVIIEKVYALVAATMGDSPRLGEYVPPTREQFSEMMLAGPDFLPEGFFLARHRARYVGMSNLRRVAAEPGVLYQMFTATLAEFRGRGIATALKWRGVRFAQARGFRTIRTDNDSLNLRIWSINQRLGFNRQRGSVWAEKFLTPTSKS